jgi:hypothetical protein
MYKYERYDFGHTNGATTLSRVTLDRKAFGTVAYSRIL